jgi:two-component sensor histidine kinase
MTRNLNLDCQNRAPAAPLDLMVREANHRIANSLQALLCPVRAEGARELQVRVAAIATVHRLLSASGDQTTVNSDEFFGELVAGLGITWGGQNGVEKIILTQAPMRIGGDAALSLGIVINELVTNACKYAYREGRSGDVRIAFSVSDGSFLLLLADDGAGQSPTPTKRGGFGRRLIELVASRFDGAIGYQPGEPGTVAVFTGRAEMLLPQQLSGR